MRSNDVFARVRRPEVPANLRTPEVRRAERWVAAHASRPGLLDRLGSSRTWWFGWVTGLALTLLAEPPGGGASAARVRALAQSRGQLLAATTLPGPGPGEVSYRSGARG